jgi:serine/threonine protein kinase
MSNGYETPEGIYFNEKMDGIGPDVLTTSLDIFSLAIIIHEYFTGVKPDIGAEPNVAMAVIRNQPVRMHPSLETTKIYHNAKVSYASLLNWMLDFNYKNSPSAIQILKILSGTSFDIPLAYLTKEDKVTRFTIDRLFEDHEPFFKFKTQSELQTLGVNSITRANNGIHYHVSQAGLSKQMSLKDLVKLGYVSRYHRPPLPVIPDFRFVAQDKLESLGIYHLHFDDTKNMFGIYYYDKKVFYANKDTLFYSLNIIEKVASGKPKPLESSISPTLGKDKPVEFCTPFPEHNITFNEDSARKLNIVKITRNEAEKKYFIYKSGSEQPTNTFVDTLIMNRVGVKKK